MHRVRSIFLSDIHLGTRACQAERLLSFLRAHEAEHVYLLGDIIDFWSLARGVYWPPLHNTFVQKMLKRARHGVKVTFVPGNHDEALREYTGSNFGDIRVVREAIHTAADGRRYLLIHGDEFDQVTRYHRWVTSLGDYAYGLLLRLNVLPSWLRRKLHVRGYWSLADYAKRKLKGALEFVYGFEESVAHHVRTAGYDGVICGHIHSAAIKDIGGIRYINCGDWVDSCSAIVEHEGGRMELVRWQDDTVLRTDLSLVAPQAERGTGPGARGAAAAVIELQD